MTVQLSDAIREVLPSARADLERLVRIPSVSADPDATHRVWASAGEVATLLREAGLPEARSGTRCAPTWWCSPTRATGPRTSRR
jgi:hypothetical protein